MTAMRKSLASLFVCLLLLSALTAVFHHHDDGADHHDCSICVVHHQAPHTGSVPLVVRVERLLAETSYPRPVAAPVGTTFRSPANDRAPPA
jgi:hypothetical protein